MSKQQSSKTQIYGPMPIMNIDTKIIVMDCIDKAKE